MSNTILLKRSALANSAPSTGNLALGELAINTSDGRLFTKIDPGIPAIVDLTKTDLVGDVSGNRVSDTGVIATTLANTTVTAGTYGNAQAIPSFTVDSKGRLTAASTFAINTAGIANGSSNISIAVSGGNIAMSVGGTSNVMVVANTGITITGTATASGNVTAPFFIGNVVGNITGNIAAAGSNTQVLFNDDNIVNGSSGFTFDKNGNLVTVAGNIDVAGTVLTDNILGSGTNVTITAGSFTSTFDDAGNVSMPGNLDVTANVSANYFLGNGALLTGIDTTLISNGNSNVQIAVANGNVTVAVTGTPNVATFANTGMSVLGTVSATGNVSGNNIVSLGLLDANDLAITGNIAGNLLPAANITYNLGSNTQRWNDIWLANSTIYLGSAQISANSTSLTLTNPEGGTVVLSGASPEVSSVTVVASGNIDGGNLNTGGLVSAIGNIIGGNINTAGNVSGGNLISAADVTTVSVTASGNVDAANVNISELTAANVITANNITVSSNVQADSNVVTDSLINRTGALVIATTSNDYDIRLAPNGSGVILANNTYIREVANPNQANDAATKQYVDDAVSAGIHIHAPVDVETPTALPSATYAQGGQVFTVDETIAGNIVVFTTAANLQVNDQLWFDNSFNGVVGNLAYFVVSTPNTSAAVLSTQYNGVPISNITSGSGLTESVRVNSGIGATLTATANGALTVDGFSVSAGNRILVYNQLTQYENGVYSVTAAGNVTTPWVLTRASDSDQYVPDTNDGMDQGSYYFVQRGDTGAGESYVLTQPTGPFIIGLANIEFTQFSASQVYQAGVGLTLTGTTFSVNASQPQITEIGSLISLDVAGNANVGNLGTAQVVATANVAAANLVTGGGVFASTVSASGNVAVGNLSTGGQVAATGNITGGNLATAGVIAATGNVSGGNITTAGQVVATGNVTSGNLITGGVVSAVGNITGGNLSGNNIVGTLLTAAQPNITSLGNLTVANIGTVTISTLANIIATTDAVSNVTGALTVAGGVGIVGNVYAGDIYKNGVIVLNADDTIDGGTY